MNREHLRVHYTSDNTYWNQAKECGLANLKMKERRVGWIIIVNYLDIIKPMQHIIHYPCGFSTKHLHRTKWLYMRLIVYWPYVRNHSNLWKHMWDIYFKLNFLQSIDMSISNNQSTVIYKTRNIYLRDRVLIQTMTPLTQFYLPSSHIIS